MITIILPAPLMVLFEISKDLKPVKLEVDAQGVINLHLLFAKLALTYPKFDVLANPTCHDRLHNVMLYINGSVVRVKDPKRFSEVPVNWD